MSPSLSELAGRRLRSSIPVQERGAEYVALRERLVTEAQGLRTRRIRNRRVSLLAIPAVAVAAMVILGVSLNFRAPPSSPLAFTVGEGQHIGRAGAYYAANAGNNVPLRFADGSAVTLEQQSGLRVSGAERSRVSVLLETGSATFDVVPGNGTLWEVTAGPYIVRVTGTSFWLSWDMHEGALDLQMRAGSVLVTGPGIETGRRVSGTERFATRVTMTSSQGGGLGNVERSPPPEQTVGEAAPPIQELAPQPTRRAESSSPASRAGLDVREGARAGRRSADSAPSSVRRSELASTPQQPRESALAPSSSVPPRSAAERLSAAEREGFSRVVARASALELLALADAARFERRPALARIALLEVRSRFPGSSEAVSAAFVLGRLADDAGSLREAIGWYDLHARGSGSLAPEALGRKFLALHRLGDVAARNRAAAEYLERYSDGPYARQARDLTSP